MKIVHFSDTHLGFSDLDILNEENINLREADFYDAFSQVINYILDTKPDYIIHTGDLFHRSSPSNRAISFALSELKKIEDANIVFILIAGNHSTPRTNLSSPILKIFENFKNVYLSYNQLYEKFEFDNIVFHTIPHINDNSKANIEIDKIEQNIDSNKKNILMLHCSVGASYLMDEFGEWVFPNDKEFIFDKMDYVALGHWHGFKQVNKLENVYYCGSLERTGNDKRNTKGFIELNFTQDLKIEFKPIKVREFISKEIDCANYEKSLQNLKTDDIKEKIVDVVLTNLTITRSIDINNKDIKDLFLEATYVNIKREFIKTDKQSNILDIENLSLEEYFLDHIKNENDEKDFLRLKDKIKDLFLSYEELSNDS